MTYKQIFAATALIACLGMAAFSQTRNRNGKIAFTSDRDGNPEIYVVNSDGTNERRLTTNTTIDDQATWSPDGRTIAFLGQNPSGQFAIFKMNADGTGRTEIAQVNYQFPNNPLGWRYWSMSWSPDGRSIAFQDGSSINIVQSNGAGRRFLVAGRQPAWSPDGAKIIFTQQPVFFYSRLYAINTDGTGIQPLAFVEGYTDFLPTFAPDGQKIVFQTWDVANTENLVFANADGTNRQDIFAGGGSSGGYGGQTSPDWSPDGREIVYCHDGYMDNIEPEIYVMNINSGTPRQITNSAGRNVNPSWQTFARIISPVSSQGDGRPDER